MTKKTAGRTEVDKLREEFGEIPEVDRNVIDALGDAFMEAIDTDDPEIKEGFIESLIISFYVGVMSGIPRGLRGECPYMEDCEKKDDTN